jgi:hypothetical protein
VSVFPVISVSGPYGIRLYAGPDPRSSENLKADPNPNPGPFKARQMYLELVQKLETFRSSQSSQCETTDLYLRGKTGTDSLIIFVRKKNLPSGTRRRSRRHFELGSVRIRIRNVPVSIVIL